MSVIDVLRSFAHDKQLSAVALLIAADLVFGVLGAFKTRSFDFSEIADFLHDDVLGKVVPWFAVFSFAKVTHGDAILGVNFSTISDGAFAFVTAALVASLLTSFQDLGLPLPESLAKVGIGRAAGWRRGFVSIDAQDLGDQAPPQP